MSLSNLSDLKREESEIFPRFCLKFCFVGDGNKKKREAKTDEGILYYPCHEIWNKFDHFEFHKTRKFTWVDNFFWL